MTGAVWISTNQFVSEIGGGVTPISGGGEHQIGYGNPDTPNFLTHDTDFAGTLNRSWNVFVGPPLDRPSPILNAICFYSVHVLLCSRYGLVVINVFPMS